jgi:large subunit ribosomal protein L1
MAMNKRQKAILAAVVQGKAYGFDEAVKIIKNATKAKFVESVDVAGAPGRGREEVRSAGARFDRAARRYWQERPRGCVRPGLVPRPDEALAAGADIVGMDDLAEKMMAGDLNYDVVIATPDAMRVVGKLGQVLGPRGLMPNPKVGTVSPNAAEAVKNAKGGQVRYRTDKAGIIHCTIGKSSFNDADLKGNLEALLHDLIKAKPATSKGQYLQKISISSTMGPGVTVDQASLALK